MAEISIKEHKQKAGVRKTKKATLRVDLTPMVDLGFLLISFFVFTTTLAQPNVMKLSMPDDKDVIDSSKVAADKTLNLLLSKNNEVYFYNGDNISSIQNIGSDVKALRAIIINKKNALTNKYGNDSGMTVLIKPTSQSTYKDVVNALDEMLICNIKTYILMDANNNETAVLQIK